MKNSFIYLFILLCSYLNAQIINIHSISKDREPTEHGMYTLDGHMIDNARLKLLEPSNFGPLGTYPKSVTITDAYVASGSLTQINTLPVEDLFFFGAFDILDFSTHVFTSQEIDAVYDWSKRGGKVIITSVQKWQNYNSALANSKWGVSWKFKAPNTFIPTTEGINTDIFSGPFGNVTTATQGGLIQGFFDTIMPNSKVFARDNLGNPTLIMDCNTLDLLVSDVDAFTAGIGTVSFGPFMNNPQDKFWGNIIAFMDALQPLPVLTNTNNNLTLNSSYTNYQWFLNGDTLSNNTSENYNATVAGNYYAEVTLNGGCVLKTNTITIDSVITDCEVFVPTAFSPNNNGINETLCVYGKCIKDLDFKIFDRWGELVFKSTDQTKCWDGIYKGEKLNSAVFAYTLKATLNSGNEIIKKGNITIVR